MAEIKNYKNHSTIQIVKDIHFVFGSLENEGTPVEKIKSSISEFKKYHELIGEDAPEVVMAWRSAQEGDWVVSDDFRVIQILRRTESKIKKSYNTAVIRTCVGTFAVNPKTFLDTDFKLHPDRYRISSANIDQTERVVERDKITHNEKVFAQRIAQGDSAEKAYMKTFPTTNESYAKGMAKTLLRQERIQKNISAEVETLLESEGVTKRYIIQQYKELIDGGMLDLKNCSGSVRAALNDLADISGMKPDKTKSSSAATGVLQEVDDDLLDEIENAEYSVVENGVEDEEEFKQEFLPESKERMMDKPFEKIGDNLLTKSGMDLLS